MFTKIDLAQQLLLEGSFNGNITKICDAVEELEQAALKRGWIPVTVCSKCGNEVHTINLGTLKSPLYEVRCDCRQGRGITQAEAVEEYLKKDD